MLHRAEAALAAQPAVSAYADIQQGDTLFIDAAAHRVFQDSPGIFQHIKQTRHFGNGYCAAYLPAIPGKIQAVDERPCEHEARMIYFSPLPVKNLKEYR